MVVIRDIRHAALGLGLGLSFALGGCCAACAEDDLPLTRNLTTKYNTVDFARFVAREGCWERIWDLLSTKAQERLDAQDVGRERVERYFRFVEVGDLVATAPAEYKDLAVRDLIARSEVRSFYDDGPERTYVFLRYERLQASIPVVQEEKRWKLDIYGMEVKFLPP